MDVKIGGSSRSSSRSLSPKDIAKLRPLTKSYRNRNASSSPDPKDHSQSRSPSRDEQHGLSRFGRTSQDRSHKRSRSPSRDSKHGREKKHHSGRDKKIHDRSRDRKRCHSHERRRSPSREKRRSHSRDKRYSPVREKRRSGSRDRRHSPGRIRLRSSSRDRFRRHSREKSSSYDRKRSPHIDSKHSRSYSRDRNKRSRSRSPEKRLKDRCKNSPIRFYRKRSRSISPRKTDSKKFKDGPLSKTTELTRDGADKEKPSSLPLNLNPGGIPQGQMMTPQLLLQKTMAAVSAQAAGITGVPLPKYYNPTAVNPLKYAEQMQKRKLLWQGTKEKPEPTTSNMWQKTTFNEDQDGKMTAKFRKLMGIKEKSEEQEEEEQGTEGSAEPSPALLKQEALFRDLDQQYEVARISTHTQRGVGLGYSGHPTLIFPK